MCITLILEEQTKAYVGLKDLFLKIMSVDKVKKLCSMPYEAGKGGEISGL